MEYVLETSELTKQYRDQLAVDHISLRVKSGEIYGFVGKNGAGKTTFIRMLLGMSVPTEGSFRFFDGTELSQAKRKIGSLIESPALYKNLTGIQNLKICCTMLGIDMKQADELMELVGLPKTGKKKVKDYSLGMKQRLGIAMALVGDPDLLILDEPINGLDPKGIVEIREMLLHLRDQGKTIFISSHLLGELEKTATCYGIISQGKLVEQITAEELLKKCGKKTVMKTGDPRKAKEIIGKLLHHDRMTIDGEKLLIEGEIPDIGELTNALFREKITVMGISEDESGVEDYFLQKMEEGV